MNIRKPYTFQCFFALLFIGTIGCCVKSGAMTTEREDIAKEKEIYSKKAFYHDTIRGLWKKRRPVYLKWLQGSAQTPYNLYNLQNETNNLLKYAGLTQDVELTEELILLYAKALDTLDETDAYAFYYYPDSPRRSVHKLSSRHKMWLDNQKPVGDESILVSSQFLYLLSEATDIVSRLPPDKQTPAMQNAIRQFVPVLLDHYKRWVFDEAEPFQVRGWGCKMKGKYVETGMNHFTFVKKKLNRELGDQGCPSYCNAVTDTDMWIIAGVVNLLAAHRKDSSLVVFPQEWYNQFLAYAGVGIDLLKTRFVYPEYTNFAGQPVTGALFDAGAWDDHSDYAYAGYCGKEYPDPGKKKKGKDVGWDLSHARRFVHVFDALHKHRVIFNMDFPSEDFMKMLTNQFLYATFHRDFKLPLFSNFMDGSNGWFRAGYEDRVGFGYGPWDMSISVLTGGYGFWSIYNPDVETVFRALLEMINTTDPEVREHLQIHYEKNYWSKYERPRNIDFSQKEDAGRQSVLIQFLPSLYYIIQ